MPVGRTTVEKGRDAEARACRLMVSEGYELIAQNVRRGRAEIDVVATDGDVLCFVEVRSRESDAHGAPIETIDRKKRRQITRAASLYLVEIPQPHPKCRFDVVTISGSGDDAVLEIMKGAFEVEP